MNIRRIKKYFILILLILSEYSFAQTVPSLEISSGFSFPAGELGGDLVFTNDSGVSNISNTFIKENYANSLGVTILGSLKIPLTKNEVIHGLISGGYTYFNVFRKSFFGVGTENNFEVPVTYDSRFSVTTFGLGVEVNPGSKSKFSPFVNSVITLNLLSLSLVKNDFQYALFSDSFRAGLLTNAGLSVRLNNEYKLLISGSYHLANLLFKSSSSNIDDRVSFGRENIPVNDEEGIFYSNLSATDSVAEPVNGSQKNVNWWGINIGLNIVLGKSSKK